MTPNPEFVVQANGEVRQAGATQASGAFVKELKTTAQGNLYVFTKGILGLNRLTPTLHLPICNWLQRVPPYRKMLLIPRDCLKTSMAKSFCIHTTIQDAETNCYLPGMIGTETRILIACESSTNAEHSLGWIEAHWESNTLLRALWPHCVWSNPRRDAPHWNAKEMTLPRKTPYNEQTIETIGVGGAIASRHYNILFKDDLISRAAANSSLVMEDSWGWHIASRALFDDPEKSLEMMTGTHWAVNDVWQRVRDGDMTVDSVVRSLIENGESIFPELFPMRVIEQLMKPELQGGEGTLFWLNRMNMPINPDLSDFDETTFKFYTLDGDGQIVLAAGEPTLSAREAFPEIALPQSPVFPPGTRMTPDIMRQMAQGGARMRFV